MIDALQITDTTLVCVVRIRLQSIGDIHVRCGFTYGHHLDDTFTGRVRKIVPTDESITLGYQRDIATLHGCGEVLECNPVQSVFTQGHVTDTNTGNDQFVLLRNVVTVIFRRHAIILLHHNAVIHTERIIQFAVLRIEPHLAR